MVNRKLLSAYVSFGPLCVAVVMTAGVLGGCKKDETKATPPAVNPATQTKPAGSLTPAPTTKPVLSPMTAPAVPEGITPTTGPAPTTQPLGVLPTRIGGLLPATRGSAASPATRPTTGFTPPIEFNK